MLNGTADDCSVSVIGVLSDSFVRVVETHFDWKQYATAMDAEPVEHYDDVFFLTLQEEMDKFAAIKLHAESCLSQCGGHGVFEGALRTELAHMAFYMDDWENDILTWHRFDVKKDL